MRKETNLLRRTVRKTHSDLRGWGLRSRTRTFKEVGVLTCGVSVLWIRQKPTTCSERLFWDSRVKSSCSRFYLIIYLRTLENQQSNPCNVTDDFYTCWLKTHPVFLKSSSSYWILIYKTVSVIPLDIFAKVCAMQFAWHCLFSFNKPSVRFSCHGNFV